MPNSVTLAGGLMFHPIIKKADNRTAMIERRPWVALAASRFTVANSVYVTLIDVGSPNASLIPEQSIEHVHVVIDGLTVEDFGALKWHNETTVS